MDRLMNLMVEHGTATISNASVVVSFSESHKSIPIVTLICNDNQAVFISDVSQNQMTLGSSSEQEAIIHYRAISRA